MARKLEGRYNVKQYKRSGEGTGVDEVIDDYRSRIPSIISGKNETEIFNCDEPGLFYRAMPDKTLAEKGDAVKGGKLAKERLTVLFCEKLKPLVIDIFNGVNVSQLPVTWEIQQQGVNEYCYIY